MSFRYLFLILIISLFGSTEAKSQKLIRIGSRDFPESILVAEILAQSIESQTDYKVIREFNLGSTSICISALNNKQIEIYPEYTGSLLNLEFGREFAFKHSIQDLETKLKNKKLQLSKKIGFDNNFSIIMNKEIAEKNKISKISDLKLVPGIKSAFDHNFSYRTDGLQRLESIYQLNFINKKIINHALIIENLKNKNIELSNSFSTDSRIDDNLTQLEDDQKAFLNYDAVFIYKNLNPEIIQVIESIKISNKEIIKLNKTVLDGKSYEEVASSFLKLKPQKPNLYKMLLNAFFQHIYLSLISVLLASLAGVSIALILNHYASFSAYVISIISALQTIPSLALLALLVPIFGLGAKTSIIALFLYSILPIIQNTYTGLQRIDPDYIDQAKTMSMRSKDILFKIKLRLTAPFIIAGIKTATVICISTTTLATYVGAGGLGDLIKSGIELNDNQLIVLGAIPVSLLAIISSYLLSKLESRLSF